MWGGAAAGGATRDPRSVREHFQGWGTRENGREKPRKSCWGGAEVAEGAAGQSRVGFATSSTHRSTGGAELASPESVSSNYRLTGGLRGR